MVHINYLVCLQPQIEHPYSLQTFLGIKTIFYLYMSYWVKNKLPCSMCACAGWNWDIIFSLLYDFVGIFKESAVLNLQSYYYKVCNRFPDTISDLTANSNIAGINVRDYYKCIKGCCPIMDGVWYCMHPILYTCICNNYILSCCKLGWKLLSQSFVSARNYVIQLCELT